MALNVTTAVIGENCNTATATPSLAQWDQGQKLKIEGVDLPASYQVEFSTAYTRNAIQQIGDTDGVTIPNELLQRSAPITAYIVLHEGENDRETEYWITIHITPRTPPETITPDPEEMSVIDQTIAALQEGVAEAEAAAEAAEGSAEDAAGQAEDAEAWAVGQRGGADVTDQDPTYHNNSKYYAGVAEAAAEEAGQHEASWESWAQRAETAAGNAEGSATAAGQSKAAAEAAAQTATQKANAAASSATEAADSASEAAQTVAGGVGAINTARDGALSAIGQAGTTQTGAVNQAGANQVAAVNQAGATQVQAVEDKGDEVLDSIPQDYSELVDDVADLSRQISDVEGALTESINKGEFTPKLTWTNGYILASNGKPASSSSYKYSQLIPVSSGIPFEYKTKATSALLALALYETDSGDADTTLSIIGTGNLQMVTGVIPNGINYARITTNVDSIDSVYFKYPIYSVRKASDDLTNEIATVRTDINNKIVDDNSIRLQGYLSSGGGFTQGGNFCTTDFIKVEQGVNYVWNIKNTSDVAIAMRYICFYDKDKTCVRNYSVPAGASSIITYPNAYYARFNCSAHPANIKTFDIYPEGEQNPTSELNSNLVVPQINGFEKEQDLLHARRPLIGIVFDGFYDMNETMLAIVKSHGYVAGIAPQYTGIEINDGTTATNLYRVRQWKKMGHEILVHGSYILDDSVDLETGAAYIKAAYTTMLKYGFDPNGYIASNGAMVPKFIPYVKKYFSWGATAPNHSTTGTSTIDFMTDNPYRLWRYSMQLSTLEEQKAAVDTAIENNRLLLFYAHCNSEQLGYFTEANFEELLDYIDGKVADLEIEVKSPTEAITDFYTIRYEDVVTA